MSDEILSVLFTLAFFAALAAWMPLQEATRTLLAASRRRHRIARLHAEALSPDLYRLLPSRSGLLRRAASACSRLLRRARFALVALTAMLLLCPALAASAESPAPPTQAVLPPTAAVSGGQTVFVSRVNLPYLMTTDANGNLYFTSGGDTYSASPTGVTTQLDNSGSSDSGIAVDASGNVYVGQGSQIVKLGPGGAAIPVATLPSAVSDVAVDTQGNFYAVNSFSLIKIAPGGGQSVLFSGGPSSFSVTSVAVDTSGDVFYAVSGSGSGYVGELKTDGTTAQYFGNLLNPGGVAVDTAGNIYVADSSAEMIFKYTAATGTTQSFVNGGAYGLTGGVAVDRSGNVFVDEFSTIDEEVDRIAPSTAVNFGSVNVCPAGQTTPGPCTQTEQLTFTITSTGVFGAPVGLTQGAPGLDFSVASTTCTGAQVAGTACTVNVTFSPQYPGARNGAVELVDATGNVLATTNVYGTGQGPQFAYSLGTQSTLPTNGLFFPGMAAVDGQGNVYITGQESGVVKLAPDGTQTTIANFNSTNGIAVDGAGNLYVASSSSSLSKISPTGTLLGTVGSNLSQPNQVAVDQAGNVFIADTYNGRVVEVVAATGAQTTIISGLLYPFAVAVDGAGNVYVPDNANSRILKVPAGGGAPIPIANVANPPALAVDAAGDVFISSNDQRVFEAPAGGGALITFQTNTQGVGGITFDAAGNLFVVDTIGYQVREFNRSQAPGFTFASTPVGQTSSDSPQSVQIQNIGNQPLSAIPPGLSVGANFAQVAGNGTYTDCTSSFSLTPGALCNLSIAFTPQQVGSIQSSAVFTDNSLNNTAPAATQTISLSGTGNLEMDTITFTNPASGASYAYGQSFQAAVSTSNTGGSVIYSSGTPSTAIVTPAGMVTIVGVGSVTLQASQSASGNYAAGSGSVTFNAAKAATKTTLTGAINSNPGNTATLTASVAAQNPGNYAAQPGGTVTFYNTAGTAIGTVNLVSGQATLTTPAYSGSQSFTAVYNGDTNYAISPASNSVPLTFSVAPTINFTTAATYAYGQSFQAMATSNSAGAITYSVISGPATATSAGAVTVTGEGTVVLQANQAAAPGYNAGSKQASFNAIKATSTTKLSATAVKSGNGSAASLTATVAPQFSGTPSGSVTFYDGTTKLATVALSGGTASYTTGQLVGAQHSYSATYLGDTNFTASTSNTAPLTIPVTAVSLQLASTNLVYPLPPAFEIIVSAASGKPAPTGTVTIYDGSTAVGTYPLNAQTRGYLFGLVLPPLNVGTHPLTAVYSGDANYAPGTSATVTVTVTPGPVKLSLGCQNTALKLGQTLTCTVNADEGPLPVTGTVSYTVTGWGSGSVTLNKAGHATITYPTPQKGNFTLTATYAAQGNYQAASSASVNFTVN